ncbi:ABC transporter substrate-binding protein [Arsenicicoccus cauae]|uniref:ABC transporter substrate-binding protein n=2 Tax=Arsenicicoccus TaxID=267408 RepID=A0A6I3IIW4_9MICO|nr:ABC transporter substrate-binding protein [Arsenicicoccus cauae]MTB71615.1 ABC transporter substrate-binding protein [Arsenicicoccus cauae]
MSERHARPTPTRRELLLATARGGAALGLAGLTANGARIAVAPTVSGWRDDAGALGRELRIGYLPITDAAALLTAHQRGFLADAGLPAARPVLFRGWESLAQAFLVGDVDVVHLLMPFALQLRLAQHADVRVLAWGHTNGSALTVGRSITRTEQLAGTTVAIPYWWSVHNVLLQRLLAASGLRAVVRQAPSVSAGTVQLVVMSPAEMVPALASGRVSGFVVAEPFCSVAEVKGVGRVLRFLGDVWHDHACCGIAVRGDLVDAHPAAAQALTTGVVQAQQWLEGHRADAAAVLGAEGGYLPQPAAAVSRVITGRRPPATITRHPGWQGQRLGFSAYPRPGYTAELASLMQATTVDGDRGFLRGIDPGTVHAGLVDERFVRQAARDLHLPLPVTTPEEVAP